MNCNVDVLIMYYIIYIKIIFENILIYMNINCENIKVIVELFCNRKVLLEFLVRNKFYFVFLI